MNIANNILKHSLQNVYFLTGTALAGKTTMSKVLAEKHGFIHFNDNWHEDNFKVWESIIDPKYQINASKRQEVTDWEAYFGRSVEEFLAAGDYNGYGEYLEYEGLDLKLGNNYLDNLEADIIFRTPGLMPWEPLLQKALKKGALLTSEMEVFFKVCPCKIIGVTGSDGKTTTTSIIGEMLKKEGYITHVGGNIGTPLLCQADSMSPDDYVVVELSSYQLITMSKSPHIAVVTNISPNHLDTHKDIDEYVRAKQNIVKYQNKNDIAVLNFDNGYTPSFASLAKSKKVYFSWREKPKNSVYLEDGTIYNSNSDEIIPIMQASDILLPGLHNVENYMATFAALREIVSIDTMIQTAREFTAVSHRIEFVKEVNNVKYYNDSIATTPSRTIAALNSFDKKVILIAGGKGKGLSYDELAKEILEHCKVLILTGMSANEINKAVMQSADYYESFPIYLIDDLTYAVNQADFISNSGDIVLFSPACTSFDKYKNFEERGDKFKSIVNSLLDWK